ncbi:lysis protein [Dryocola clanedunensis]|uniref:lysis protein n=1 Tax=Dryocola clanedunensis TaxID=2925396 RepID=UPI0022F06A9C|nr:lysis protein [Dryocola clanedunensis]
MTMFAALLKSLWKPLALILLVASLLWGVQHYRGKYISEQARADAAESLASNRQSIIDDMTVRQRNVAALDAKYTGELANAKATIEQLQRDVAAGTKRLHFAATCTGVSDSSGTSGVGNASTPTITAGAERDYWRLRDGINTVTGQVKYLQDYIRQQCVK